MTYFWSKIYSQYGSWKACQGAAVTCALLMALTGCGKNSTVTTPKPSLSSVTTVETVPVTTKQVKTTTFGPDGKPVKVEVKPIPEPGK